MSANWYSDDGRFRATRSWGGNAVRIEEYIRDDGWFNVDTWVPYLEVTRDKLDFADKVLREMGL